MGAAASCLCWEQRKCPPKDVYLRQPGKSVLCSISQGFRIPGRRCRPSGAPGDLDTVEKHRQVHLVLRIA